MEFVEYEYRTAKRAASSVARLNKGYLDAGDTLGAIYEWMCANYELVEKWREEGSKGYLNTALYRAGLRYAAAERKARTGAQDDDLHYYTVGQLETLLPQVWDYEDWTMVASDAPNYIFHGASGNPAEGNNLVAMLVDVAYALRQLDGQDQELLERRFRDRESMESIAMLYELTEDGMRKHIKRIIKRMVRSLGGEPPFWDGTGSRTVRSNAQAQAEVST